MLTLALIAFAVIGTAFAIIAIRAPLGFEDATGFHLGEPLNNAGSSLPDSDEPISHDPTDSSERQPDDVA